MRGHGLGLLSARAAQAPSLVAWAYLDVGLRLHFHLDGPLVGSVRHGEHGRLRLSTTPSLKQQTVTELVRVRAGSLTGSFESVAHWARKLTRWFKVYMRPRT